jgi:hypothetical protein
MDDLDCGGGACVANDSLCSGGSCAAPFPWPKSRYIGFNANVDASWVGQQIAVRVKLIDVKDHPECNGQVRWVGPPTQYCESGACAETFMASSLQDAPYFTDWTLQGVVQVMGEEIVPQSRYALQAIDSSKSDELENESIYSTPALWVDTAKWADVVPPLAGFTLAGQPQVSDVLSLVDKWLGSLEPRKARAQLQPQIPNPGADVAIADILKAVDAWLGSPYPYPIDSCSP